MYLYNEELQCPLAPPVYQTFKQVCQWLHFLFFVFTSLCIYDVCTGRQICRLHLQSKDNEEPCLSLADWRRRDQSIRFFRPGCKNVGYCGARKYPWRLNLSYNEYLFLFKDGYLRIFSYHQMELLSYMKSYFGEGFPNFTVLNMNEDSYLQVVCSRLRGVLMQNSL